MGAHQNQANNRTTTISFDVRLQTVSSAGVSPHSTERVGGEVKVAFAWHVMKLVGTFIVSFSFVPGTLGRWIVLSIPNFLRIYRKRPRCGCSHALFSLVAPRLVQAAATKNVTHKSLQESASHCCRERCFACHCPGLLSFDGGVFRNQCIESTRKIAIGFGA